MPKAAITRAGLTISRRARSRIVLVDRDFFLLIDSLPSRHVNFRRDMFLSLDITLMVNNGGFLLSWLTNRYLTDFFRDSFARPYSIARMNDENFATLFMVFMRQICCIELIYTVQLCDFWLYM